MRFVDCAAFGELCVDRFDEPYEYTERAQAGVAGTAKAGFIFFFSGVLQNQTGQAHVVPVLVTEV